MIPCFHTRCHGRFWSEATPIAANPLAEHMKFWPEPEPEGLCACKGVSGVQKGPKLHLPASTSSESFTEQLQVTSVRIFCIDHFDAWCMQLMCMQNSNPLLICSDTMHYQCMQNSRRCNVAQRATYFSAYQPFRCCCYRYFATPCLRILLGCQWIDMRTAACVCKFQAQNLDVVMQ